MPAGVDTLVFPNYESLPEREDVSDPFTEVRALDVALDSGCWAAERAARALVVLQGPPWPGLLTLSALVGRRCCCCAAGNTVQEELPACGVRCV